MYSKMFAAKKTTTPDETLQQLEQSIQEGQVLINEALEKVMELCKCGSIEKAREKITAWSASQAKAARGQNAESSQEDLELAEQLDELSKNISTAERIVKKLEAELKKFKPALPDSIFSAQPQAAP